MKTRKQITSKYNHSKLGVCTNMYFRQLSHSKKRGHKPPSYTKEWLYEYLVNNKTFNDLYNLWALSGYDKWLIPSVDRIDDNIGYEPTNIQVITFRENNLKGGKSLKAGITRRNGGTTDIKPVVKMNEDYTDIETYISSHEAERRTGIAQQNIGKVCLGKRPRAGGFRWRYK